MKKLLLTILLLFIFFAWAGFAQATTTIVKDYPELPGTDKPGEARKGEELPQFIKYLFVFSLSIVGIIGLAAIIIGAFGYLTAVGNPQKAAKAKEQIFSALLGIILLLGSYLLLRVINPDLLSLGVELEPAEEKNGETEISTDSYACYCCCFGGSWWINACNPLNGYRLFCESDLTASQASTTCSSVCKMMCDERLVPLGNNSQAIQETCQ